jgi:uncharacterized coiled-coil protein SlyX
MENTFKCVCGKTYAQHQNMYRHRKNCKIYNKDKDVSEPDVETLKNKILEYEKIIAEQDEIMAEQDKTMAEQNEIMVEQNKTIEKQKFTILLQEYTIAMYDKFMNNNATTHNQCNIAHGNITNYVEQLILKPPIQTQQSLLQETTPSIEVIQETLPCINRSKNYKVKEKDVANRIMNIFSEHTWCADKRITGGCSLRRPDLLLDLGTHVIIIEVDEFKHTAYEESHENLRIMEISKDLQHRPIVLIRFNPDEYRNAYGQLVRSCWVYDENGIITIEQTRMKEWEERIDCLVQQIKYWINNSTEKTIEIVKLFYS